MYRYEDAGPDNNTAGLSKLCIDTDTETFFDGFYNMDTVAEDAFDVSCQHSMGLMFVELDKSINVGQKSTRASYHMIRLRILQDAQGIAVMTSKMPSGMKNVGGAVIVSEFLGTLFADIMLVAMDEIHSQLARNRDKDSREYQVGRTMMPPKSRDDENSDVNRFFGFAVFGVLHNWQKERNDLFAKTDVNIRDEELDHTIVFIDGMRLLHKNAMLDDQYVST